MSSNSPKKSPRNSGIFLHPSSLPGNESIGTLGQQARDFVDWLHKAGQEIWQIMPLGPTGYGNSPYATLSAFAGNPMLIDLETLVAQQLLDQSDLESVENSEDLSRVDFEKILKEKPALLKKAWDSFKIKATSEQTKSFHAFCDQHNEWLNDYAQFAALKSKNDNKAWYEWDDDTRTRDPAALQKLEADHGDLVGAAKFIQWLFFSQWHALRHYAAERKVKIMGDVPIFVAHDSADVWAKQDLFHLNQDGTAALVAGVPPDYFSDTGQLWGNPLYRWDRMQQNGYQWWLRRIAIMKDLVDIVRIDHFRGFEAYWEIPGDAKTAINGRWVKGPGKDFFAAVQHNFGALPFIAEDLGVITPEVEILRDSFQLPGMKVIQFAFTDDWSHPFLPHNYIPNSVVYLGTHDNNTSVGWLESIGIGDEDEDSLEELQESFEGESCVENPELRKLAEYLELHGDESADEVNDILVHMVVSSVSKTCILMMQDLLGLGTEARINTPAEPQGNWEWRLLDDQLDPDLAIDLHNLCLMFNRVTPNKTAHASD
jgi:4-alpha-glucanotransferase